jgi:nucleoside-triphosphatase THEP1
MGDVILLTGEPRVGKTTVIQKIIENLDCEFSGFYTQEIREGNERPGFKIITFQGIEKILAHVNIKGYPRVSKYGINLQALDSIVSESLEKAIQQNKSVFVIDEIGAMEIFSKNFCAAVSKLLSGNFLVIGTIVKRSFPFTDKIKSMPNVTLLEVTRDNQETIVQEVLEFFKKANACKTKTG